MKTGKSITELASELERQAGVKRDFVSSAKALKFVTEAGKSSLEVGALGNFAIKETAHDQIASRIGIPAKYYEKMQKEAPALLDTNVNHWLQNDGNKYMVRTLDGAARAMLSDRYRPLDNLDLAQVALPTLLESGCKIESCEITDRKMYLKATTERLTFEVKKGDVVQAGIVISNSEIGHGALSVEPLLMRLICTNGMIMNDSKMRKHHVGRGGADFEGASEFYRTETRLADDKAFWMKVRDTIAHAFSTIAFEKHVERFAHAASDIVVADPIEVMEVTQKRFGLQEGEKRLVLTHWLQDGDMSRFGLANAITRSAQDIEDYDRATDFERLGGDIIELPKTDWNRIALN